MRFAFTILLSLLSSLALAQTRMSLGTEFVVQRNFSSGQEFWTIGQSIRGEWKTGKAPALYAGISYFAAGKFTNELEASAKDPATLPQRVDFNNNGRLRFTEISLGLKPYILGAWAAEDRWSVYAVTGLGLLMGRVDNTQSSNIDTTLYSLPVLPGRGRFNRLTLDLGLGFEVPVGGDLFVFSEAKSFIPISTYPSTYLLDPGYTPLTLNLGLGVRVIF